jgi:predicted exporter
MEFLLPKEQLKGLSAEDQKAAKDEAFNQFLLGSIFGGQGIASGYQAVQNIIPNMQKQRQQQGLLQELGAINKEFFHMTIKTNRNLSSKHHFQRT